MASKDNKFATVAEFSVQGVKNDGIVLFGLKPSGGIELKSENVAPISMVGISAFTRYNVLSGDLIQYAEKKGCYFDRSVAESEFRVPSKAILCKKSVTTDSNIVFPFYFLMTNTVGLSYVGNDLLSNIKVHNPSVFSILLGTESKKERFYTHFSQDKYIEQYIEKSVLNLDDVDLSIFY